MDANERPLAGAYQLLMTFMSSSPISHRVRILRAIAFFIVVVFIIVMTEKQGIPWKFGHWFFSYEYGFVKRGLIGELISWLPVGSSLSFFMTVSTLGLLAIAVLFFCIIKDMSNRDFFAFSALFLLTPLLFRNYVFDFGRYDQIAIQFVLLQIYFAGNKAYSGRLLYFSPLLLFVHEATAVWAFPSILTIAFFENRQTLYKVVPILIVSGISLMVWGGLDINIHAFYYELLEWAAPVQIDWAIVFSLTPDISGSITRYIVHFWEVFNSSRGYLAFFFFLACAFPLFMIKDRLLLFFNLAALVSVCTLFFLAVDYWRWVSLLGTSILFSLLYAHKKSLLSNPPQLSYYLMVIGLLGLFFGPIGIYPEVLAEVDIAPKRLQFFGPNVE